MHTVSVSSSVDTFMDQIRAKNQGQNEFLQAVYEVAEHVVPFIDENPTVSYTHLTLPTKA